MATPVIPVLSIDTDQLTDVRDQISYLLRHMFNNPGWTSSYLESYLISIRKLFAESGYKPNKFVETLSSKLNNTLKSMYGNAYKASVVITETTPLYSRISIDITDGYDNTVITLSDIEVNGSTIQLAKPEKGVSRL